MKKSKFTEEQIVGILRETDRLKFSNLLPYVESTRAALKYMVEWKKPTKPCLMYQDDEYGIR